MILKQLLNLVLRPYLVTLPADRNEVKVGVVPHNQLFRACERLSCGTYRRAVLRTSNFVLMV